MSLPKDIAEISPTHHNENGMIFQILNFHSMNQTQVYRHTNDEGRNTEEKEIGKKEVDRTWGVLLG